MLQCATVCCSVLQCVAVCVALFCTVFYCVAHCCSELQFVAMCCSVSRVLQCDAVCCSVLQCVAIIHLRWPEAYIASFMCDTWMTHSIDMTHSCVTDVNESHHTWMSHLTDSRVMWPIHVWRDSFICDTTHTFMTRLIYFHPRKPPPSEGVSFWVIRSQEVGRTDSNNTPGSKL